MAESGASAAPFKTALPCRPAGGRNDPLPWDSTVEAGSGRNDPLSWQLGRRARRAPVRATSGRDPRPARKRSRTTRGSTRRVEQRLGELAVLFAEGRQLGCDAVVPLEAQPATWRRAAVLVEDEALTPARRQLRGRDIDRLAVVAVGPVERRELADRAVDPGRGRVPLLPFAPVIDTPGGDTPDEAAAPIPAPLKPRRRWIAAVLSSLIPGLGHLVAGRRRLAALFGLPVVALVVGVAVALAAVGPVRFAASFVEPEVLWALHRRPGRAHRLAPGGDGLQRPRPAPAAPAAARPAPHRAARRLHRGAAGLGAGGDERRAGNGRRGLRRRRRAGGRLGPALAQPEPRGHRRPGPHPAGGRVAVAQSRPPSASPSSSSAWTRAWAAGPS